MKKNIADILFYWLIISLIIPNAILSVTESMSALARITNVVLPLGIMGLIACMGKKIGKTTLFLFPLMFLNAFQIVLIFLYGYGIISVDMFLNVLTTNVGEACELLTRLWPSLIVVVVLYMTPIIMGFYCIYHKKHLESRFLRDNRMAFGAVSICGLILLACCYGFSKGYDIRIDLFPVNIGYNMYLTDKRCQQTLNYQKTSADFVYNAHSVHDENVKEAYVIVVGETSRAHNWEILGYDRPTNPYLSKRNDLIVAKNAYSESNTTHKSVPMLLSCVDSRTFDKEIWKVKSIITAFKECGFHTAFISNQLPNHSYIDFFGMEADTTLFVKLHPHNERSTIDENLVGYVDEFLKSGGDKQLIVVHTYGSHFNYRERYGEEDRKFLPDDFYEASKLCRRELVNAYDNTIVATDHLLENLITSLSQRECIGGLLYTSDHGEDIFDGGDSNFLHASPLPTAYQLHVPLLVWLTPEYRNSYPDIVGRLRFNSGKVVSTSRSFCPTALAVGGIETGKVDNSDNLASEKFKSERLYYLNDHNKPLPFKIENDQMTIIKEFLTSFR